MSDILPGIRARRKARRLTLDELEGLVKARGWVDVCK